MKKEILGYIAREINRLTNDEDFRQELWLYFLEGNEDWSRMIVIGSSIIVVFMWAIVLKSEYFSSIR